MRKITNFRLIKDTELDELLLLYSFLNPNDNPLPSKEKVQEIWNEICVENRFNCFIAELDQKVIASCTLSIIPNLTRGAHPYGVMENVITHPDYRRRGIGTALLKHAIKYAWDHECYKVMLMTGRKDDSIMRFYTDAGFIKGIKTAFVARNYPK